MFITIQTLAAAYSQLGFAQKQDDPFVFRDKDGLMFFHDPFCGEVAAELVVEDVCCWDADVACKLEDILYCSDN